MCRENVAAGSAGEPIRTFGPLASTAVPSPPGQSEWNGDDEASNSLQSRRRLLCENSALGERCRRRNRSAQRSPSVMCHLQRRALATTVTLLAVCRTVAFMTPASRQRRYSPFAQLKDETTIRLDRERETPNTIGIDASRITGPNGSQPHSPSANGNSIRGLDIGDPRESEHRLEDRNISDDKIIGKQREGPSQGISESGFDTSRGGGEHGKTLKDDESFEQFAVVNDLVSASERVLDNLDTTSSTYTSRNRSYSSLARLSKAHHSMMAKTSNMRRQRFVTGKYPLYVSVQSNPTQKWLGLAESQIYLNGTSIERSLASYDTFHWLDDRERRELHGDYEFLSLELLAEIHVKKPGYVNILPKTGAGMSLEQPEGDDEGVFGRWKSWKLRDALASNSEDALPLDQADGERLWMTGFSLTKPRGELHTMDVKSGVISNMNDRTARAIKWPNEVASIPRQSYTNHNNTIQPKGASELEDALLVTDGFLVPGKDKGGLYVVRNPGNSVSEWRVCLTGVTNLQDVTINAGEGDWFYHRAVWMDLTGDGRLSILAARAKFPLLNSNGGAQEVGSGTKGMGQLVWLERPLPHSFDAKTGTPLDVDGTVFDPFSARNTPWKLRILDEGPDVMFSVADCDPTDDTVEIIASQFFGKKLSLHSLRIGPDPKIVFRRTIDEQCGSAFSSILADLDGLATLKRSNDQPMVVDSGSTVVSLKDGDPFSHLLVTSHECSYAEGSAEVDAKSDQRNSPTESTAAATRPEYSDQSKIDGGSLFGYRIPEGKDAWKTRPWTRSVIATGFKVQGQLNNMINPGAPGFCYTFFPTKEGGVGKDKKWHRPLIGISGDCAESAYILRPIEESNSLSRGAIDNELDKSTNYALMCEIKCKATVGSLAIGYDDLYSADQQSGYAKIYVPCYEQDKVLVFAMGNGDDEYAEDEDDGW